MGNNYCKHSCIYKISLLRKCNKKLDPDHKSFYCKEHLCSKCMDNCVVSSSIFNRTHLSTRACVYCLCLYGRKSGKINDFKCFNISDETGFCKDHYKKCYRCNRNICETQPPPPMCNYYNKNVVPSKYYNEGHCFMCNCRHIDCNNPVIKDCSPKVNNQLVNSNYCSIHQNL